MAKKIDKVKVKQAKFILSDGKEHTLKLDLNALIALEDRTGEPFDKIFNGGLTLKTVRRLLWAGLLHENADLTESEAGALIDFSTLMQLQHTLGDVVDGSLPDVNDIKEINEHMDKAEKNV